MNNQKLARMNEALSALKPVEAPPLVACYHRVSSRKQADEMTILRQESVTRELFERQFKDPTSLVRRISDEGYNFEAVETKRGFWSELVPLVMAGEVNTIVVAAEDRIFRGASAELRGRITDIFRRAGVKIITPGGTTVYDSRQTSSRLVTSITQELGAIAKLESVRTLYTGRRRRLVEDEAWRLSIVPYGYRLEVISGKRKSYVYRVQPDEAEIVKDIYALYLGEPTTKVIHGRGSLGSDRIAQLLNSQGIRRDAWADSLHPGVKVIARRDWDQQIVLRILNGEMYTGKITVAFVPTEKVAGADDWAVKDLAVPEIVSPLIWRRTQTALDLRRYGREDRRIVNWLHTIAKCRVCGVGLDGIVAGNKVRYYRCPNTTKDDPHGMLRADDVEALTEAAIVKVFTNSLDWKRLVKEVQKTDQSTDGVEEASSKYLAELNSQLKRLTESMVKGIIEEELFLEMKKELGAKIQQARLALNNAQRGDKKRPVTSLETVREAMLKALNNPERRRELAEVVARTELEAIDIISSEPNLDVCDDELRALYESGRVTAKEIRRRLNWNPKTLITKWGKAKSGRKKALDYDVRLRWANAGE